MDAQTILQESQLRPGRHTWWARLPFVVAVVAGGSLLIGLKALDLPQLIVTLVAITLILGYAATVYWTPILRLREDQLADNCYYLGFLFTLISLSWALWKFADSGNDNDIVSSFGLALGSTIIGVLLRVTINQARKDVVEIEADARMELAQSVIRLRVQIDDAVLAIGSFHKQTEQIARDAIQNAAENASSALEKNVTKMGEVSTRVIERIDQAFEEFTQNAQQLNVASAGTVKAVKSLVARIENIEAPSDVVLRRIEPAVASLESASNRLRELVKNDQNAVEQAGKRNTEVARNFAATVELFSTLQEKIELASQQSAQASEGARMATSKFAELIEEMEVVIEQQKLVAENAQKQGAGIEQAASAQLEQILEVFRRHNQAMEIELERFRASVEGSGDTFSDLAMSLHTPFIVTPAIEPELAAHE